MPQDQIFLPMGALAGLTFAVLLFVPAMRIGRKPNVQDGADSDIPGALANPNFADLLEMPVLFYVICLMLFVSGEVDQTFLYLAWGYVGLRVLHSLVHVTYNNVLQRLTLFAASNVVVTLMWGLFFYERFTAA